MTTLRYSRSRTLAVSCALIALFTSQSARAHYLWVKFAAEENVANIYFEEGPAAGDGHYLDHFATTCDTYFRSIDAIAPRKVMVADIHKGKQRWLQVKLPKDSADVGRSLECYGKFGVYAYGKTDVLLHYYARYLDVEAHDDLHELADAKHMALDIVPHDRGDQLSLTVLWQGEKAAGRMVYVRGPKGFRKNLKTDDSGRVKLKLAGKGTYTFRTNVELQQAGEDGDDTYDLIRHHATLTMKLPLEK